MSNDAKSVALGRVSAAQAKTNGNTGPQPTRGLMVQRYFTPPGSDPYQEVTWDLRSATITNEHGEVVFEQTHVEVPSFWSQTATNVVVSKYFRGPLRTPKRETSVRQLVGRVANTITEWGIKDGYFATTKDAENFRAELAHLLLHQKVSFNSPVWFNVGIEPRPQCSACQPYHALINTAQGLMPIGEIVERRLIGLPVYDDKGLTQVVAVKSNGRKPVYRIRLNDGFTVEATGDHLVCAHDARRTYPAEWHRVDQLHPGMVMRVYAHAAKTVTPPAETHVVSEAALAGWLQADGFVGQYKEGTNRSLTVEFMTADDEEHNWIMEHIKEVFPNQHYHVSDVPTEDTTKLHCRRIRFYGEALRPFVEKYGLLKRGQDIRVPELLWTAPNDAVSGYIRSLFQSDGYAAVHVPSAHVAFAVTSKEWAEDLQRLLTRFGIYARLRQKKEQRPDRYDMWELDVSIRSEREAFQRFIGFISERKNAKLRESLQMPGKECPDVRFPEIASIEPLGDMEVYDIQTLSGCYLTNSVLVHNCFILSVDDTMEAILDWYKVEGMIFKYGSGSGINLSPIRSSKEQLAGGGTASGPVSFMRAADASAGVIKSGGKTRRAAKMVVLNSDHPDVEKFIKCKWLEEKKAWALVDAGFDSSIDGEAYSSVFFQNANNSVRATDEFMQAVLDDKPWELKAVSTGKGMETSRAKDLMHLIAEATWHCGDPGMQFDTTINKWHTSPNAGRINASNPCSEYMHLDNSACNLASLNLMKFVDETGRFKIVDFRSAVRTIIIAQDIIVDNSSYPTPKVTENAKAYRELGLGYANLGALLMSLGVPYDSDEGRAYAATVTALMCGEAYRTSAEIAGVKGPYAGYQKNREPQLNVIRMHRDALVNVDDRLVPEEMFAAAAHAWEEGLRLGTAQGIRNSQVTVLAPTGCLTGNSLVVTDRGLMRLRRLGNIKGAQWQDVSFGVATDQGMRQATKFYINGRALTRRVQTEAGYEIQGTPNHRVKVFDPVTGEMLWRRLDELKAGDVVPMAMNSLLGNSQEISLPPLSEPTWSNNCDVRAPRTVTPELAELIGYFMGDGSLHSKGLRFCVTETDSDVVEHLQSLSLKLFNVAPHVTQKEGYLEVAIHSVALATWWDACGFAKRDPDGVPEGSHTGKGYQPHIPDAVLATNDRAAYQAFLRGLFEADGTSIEGVPAFCTAHAGFAQEIMSLCLALGYPMTRKVGQSGWGGESFVARLKNASYNQQFLREIGYMGKRKTGMILPVSGPMTGKRDYIYLAPSAVEELVPTSSPHRNAALLSIHRHGGIPRQRAVNILEESQDERLAEALRFFYDRVEVIEDGGEQSTYDLSVPENVTYLANGFISHNTIGFMMDCDTTGVEPDIALIKYKKLVGGGLMKIVNNTVPRALKRIGYSDAQIQAICDYLNKEETIEGAPELDPKHLPVFDCAFKAMKGTRSIHYTGHVRMMGAVQPFISGAISKTVNVPPEITVDEIMQAYIEAWKCGVKAIAIYRDGSKRVQPLSTGKSSDDSTKEKTEAPEEASDAAKPGFRPKRRYLADERFAMTHKFSIAGHDGYVTVGLYEDGKPGEIFIVMSKEGTVISGLLDAFATAISLALQYGVPLEALVKKFSHMRFEPAGITSNPQIRFAQSILDYIFRWMALKFLPADKQPQPPATVTDLAAKQADITAPAPTQGTVSKLEPSRQAFQGQVDAPPCPDCGAMMIRSGSCYKCFNCGATSGCS